MLNDVEFALFYRHKPIVPIKQSKFRYYWFVSNMAEFLKLFVVVHS